MIPQILSEFTGEVFDEAKSGSCYNYFLNNLAFELDNGGISMEIENTQYKHCDLIKITGRVDSSTAPKLAEAIDKITEASRFKIVIDMSNVDFISSAGLRVLISAQKECRRYNRGHVVFAGMPKFIMDVFDLAGFTPLFKVFEDVTAAVGYF